MSGELRFDLMSQQWVSIVGHRQGRPNLPSSGCPFCVGGLEAPEPYETRWFENRWPAYESGEPIDAALLAGTSIDRLDAVGAAEVILYSPRHDGSLGSLGAPQIRKVVDLWAERTAALLARPEIRYVLVFESRGPEAGATIHHPHGQIYAFPFVPPAATGEVSDEECRVCRTVANELAAADRVVFENEEWVAWVPFASEYPYGVRLASRRHVGQLNDLDDGARDCLAVALYEVLGRYDRLWEGDPKRSEIFPYLMWIHQQPAAHAGEDAGRYHLHFHFAPPQRSAGVARYIAAGEVGAAVMSNPVIPEVAAETLRSIRLEPSEGD